MDNPTTDEINRAAAAFEARIGYTPARMKWRDAPGWIYAMKDTEDAFKRFCSLPAKRYINIEGFDDADYVQFDPGEQCGYGVKDGGPRAMGYSRSTAEGFVQQGLWREVPVPPAAGSAREALCAALADQADRANDNAVEFRRDRTKAGTTLDQICDRVLAVFQTPEQRAAVFAGVQGTAPELLPHLRQLCHNDGSPGFVAAYDKPGVDREFAELQAEIKRLAQACRTYQQDAAHRKQQMDEQLAQTREATLEELATFCDGLATLYTDPRSGFDKGYAMAAQRVAETIRSKKGETLPEPDTYVTFTAGDETLLDQLLAWEEAPVGIDAGKLYDAAIAHIDARVAAHVAEKLAQTRIAVLDEAIEAIAQVRDSGADDNTHRPGLSYAICVLDTLKGKTP